MAQILTATMIAVVALICLLAAFVVLYASVLPATSWARIVGSSAVCAVPGAIVWLVADPLLCLELRVALVPPLAVLGAVCCFLVTLVARSAGAPLGRTIFFSTIWGCAVFVPVALRSFESLGAEPPLWVKPIDHGGALPLSVAVGASMLAVLVVERRSLIRGVRMAVPVRVGAIALTIAVLSWLAWLVGAEFALDETVGLIVVNGTVGAVAGVLGWLSVQLIAHGTVGLKSLAGGLISGLTAVTAGAPLFTPVSAAVAGVIAGAVACVFTVRKGSPLGNQLRFLVNTHLLGGTIGMLSLGILATDSGFLFTGQLAILSDQLLSVISTALYAFVVSSGVWWLFSRFGRGPSAARVFSRSRNENFTQ